MEEEPPSNHSVDTIKLRSHEISSNLSQRSALQLEWTIYRVYGHLRNINEKAYEPQVIAIGPYHRGKDNVKMMEEHKWRYLSLICQGKTQNFDYFCSAIEPLEQEARKCYADPISLDKDEFVKMLVLDGCFIIELVRKIDKEDWYDPITRMDWMISSLKRDLMLFENQIPFFVLCKLFELFEGPNQHNLLLNRLRRFFEAIIPPTVFSNRSPNEDRKSSNTCPYEIKYLLHLIRIELVPPVPPYKLDLPKCVKYERKQFRNSKSATWLAEANVKLKKNEQARSLLDIKFECGFLLIPPLIIDDGTESLFRNLIAYEQYFQNTQSTHLRNRYKCVTDYAFFFDCLINSSGDVEILSHFGIIKHDLGNDEVLAEIFNKLTASVSISEVDFIYGEIFDDVEKYCSKRWNRWMAKRNRWIAKLRRNYFNTRWAIVSFIVAVVLLLLTVAQTVLSALSL